MLGEDGNEVFEVLQPAFCAPHLHVQVSCGVAVHMSATAKRTHSALTGITGDNVRAGQWAGICRYN
jgi:hypothetical protein